MWPQSAKTVLMAIAYGYVFPFIVIWLAGFVVIRIDHQSLLDMYGITVLLYFFFFAPVFTGYLAARGAPSLPIYHGLVAVAVSMALMVLNGNLQPLWLIPVSLILAVVGARRFKLESENK